jgi:hypothetical protein
MSIVCSTEACPVILNSTCVFYQGDTLVYTGIYAGENLQTALQKIDAKFQDAGLGYVFTDGLDQPSPGYPVGLGGELTKDIEIDGDYKLTFLGRLGASAFIKNGGVASQFLKADGSVDNTDYQPAGDYISSLTGDVLASGPGSSVASLATVNGNPGTYGSSVRVPIITVDNKGRVIDVTSTAINFPPTMISLTGDVSGFGNIGTDIVVTLDAVNANAYVGNNLLKFGVDNKGRVTSAAPISYNDLTGILGFDPVPTTRTLTINGVAYNLNQNRSWNVGSVTSVTANAGPGISVAVTNPGTTPQITVTNTAPDQIVQLLSGAGIQVTGNYPNFTIKALNPISTAGGELSGTYPNPTLVNSAVVSKVLSGLNITGGTVQSTDDILTAIGKLQNQINSLIGGSIYQGVWDAATNTPTLTSSVGVKGHYYIVDVYGTTNLDGIAEWHVGDWAIYDGTEWQKVDTTDAVVSVNGLTGAVSLTTANISESGNLYFTTDRARTSLSAGVGLSYDNVNGIFSSTITQYTDALARQSISLTTTGNNGTASYDNSTGVLNIPQYTLAGLGGVPTSRTLSINGETYDLSENRSWTIAAGVTSFNTRTGAITLISGDVTDALGFTPYNSTNPSGYISGITSGMVTGALGYTPYDATNPAGYITSITSSNVTTALGYTPVTNARTLTINGTAYDLTADRSWTIAGGVTSFNTRTGAITLSSADVTGALSFTPYNSTNPSGYITSSASITGTSAGVSTTVGGGSAINLVYSQMADNDFFRIRVGGGSNEGYVEIATADDGTEPIYVRQYTGVFSSLTRTATLLDGSGNTSFPGTVTASFSGSLSGTASNASALNGWGYTSYAYRNSGTGYYQINDWIQLNGTYGLYAPSVNDAHFFPNSNSYGSWKVLGSRNGWRGLHFGEGTGMTLMMNETEFGFHREAHGWYARFTSGTGHFNISGSAASATYATYLNPLSGDGNYKLAYTADGARTNAGEWGRAVMYYVPNGQTYGIRVDRADYANSAGSISGQANSATINATSGNAGNQIVLRDGSGDIAIGTLNASHAYFGSGGRGLTAADTYGSYGNVMTYGTGQSGWYGYGIYDNSGYRSFFMSNSGNFGIYGQTIGKWAFYYGNSTASYAIGSDSPVAGYTLYLIYGLYTVGLYNASDARMKKDIKPLTSSLDKVKALRGVSYEYIDKGDDGTKNKGLELGFIAQEVLPVIPELIRYDEEKGYAMNYNGVSAVLVEAVKEQQVQIENQQIQIENQQNQINSLTLQLTEILNK